MRLQKKGGGYHGIGIDLTLASGLSRPFECLLVREDELPLLAEPCPPKFINYEISLASQYKRPSRKPPSRPLKAKWLARKPKSLGFEPLMPCG